MTARDDAAGPPEPGPPPADRSKARPAKAGPAKAGATAARPDSGSPGSGPPSYEQARDELTELVKRLEAGGLTLEQSLQLWERGERLAAICHDWLEGARARLAAAMAPRGGEAPGRQENGDSAAPF